MASTDICKTTTKNKFKIMLPITYLRNKKFGILIFITAAGGATIFRKTKTHSKNSMKRMR